MILLKGASAVFVRVIHSHLDHLEHFLNKHWPFLVEQECTNRVRDAEL